MDLGRPHASLCPSLDGDVLVVLAGTSRALTGREVARLVKRGSPSGVNLALRRLADQGVIDARSAGRAVLYSLNREHVAVSAVEALARLRTDLLDRLRSAVAGWAIPPAHASLFGSAARGDGDSRSDLDLLVAVPRGIDPERDAWRRQVDELSRRASRWTGNRATVIELPEVELRAAGKERARFLAEVKRDGVLLGGKPLERLVGRR